MKFTIRTLLVATGICAVFACGWSAGFHRASVSEPSIVSRPNHWTNDPVNLVSMGVVEFRPRHFQDDLSENLQLRAHRAAIGLLVTARIDEIIEHNPGVYFGIEGNYEKGQLLLPGVTGTFRQGRDWIIPESGNSDSLLWVELSLIFATKYNQRVRDVE